MVGVPKSEHRNPEGSTGGARRPHRMVRSHSIDCGEMMPVEASPSSSSSSSAVIGLLPAPRYARSSLSFEDLSWLETEDQNFLIVSVLNHPPKDRKLKDKYANRDTIPYFLRRRSLLRRYVLGNSRRLASDDAFGALFRTVKDLKSGDSRQGHTSEGYRGGSNSTYGSGRKQIWLVERTGNDRSSVPTVKPGTLLVCKCIDIESLFHDSSGPEEADDGDEVCRGRGSTAGSSLSRYHQGLRHCIKEDTLVEMFLSKLFTRFFACPNFDRLIDVLHDSSRVYFLFEFFEGGDLLDYMMARAMQMQSRRKASVAESAPAEDPCTGAQEASVEAVSPMSCPGDASASDLTVDRNGLKKFFDEVTATRGEGQHPQASPGQVTKGQAQAQAGTPSSPIKSAKTNEQLRNDVVEEQPEQQSVPSVVRLNVKEVCIIMSGLTKALELLHSLNLAHLDVSPEQVLVHISPENGRVVSAALTDLAQCSTVAQLRTSSLRKSGKALYRAPEMYHQLPSVLAASRPPSLWLAGDMWSLGVVGLVMCLGGPLWESATADDEKYRYFLEHAGPDVFYYLNQAQHLPAELAALLAGLLQPQPQERLTISLCRMSEALSPEFMESHDVMADSEPHQLLQRPFETNGRSQPHVGKRRMLFNAVIRSMVEVWNKVSMAIPLSPKTAQRTDTNNTSTTVDSTRMESPSQLLPPAAHSSSPSDVASPLNEHVATTGTAAAAGVENGQGERKGY